MFCSLINTTLRVVISSSIDTLAVQLEKESGMGDTPRPSAGILTTCKNDQIEGAEREQSAQRRFVVSRSR